MTVNIGIFEREQDVVEAIRLLREAGVDHDDIRVRRGRTLRDRVRQAGLRA